MSFVPYGGEKRCTKCRQTRPVVEFRVFRLYGQSDREYRRSWCKACDRAYQVEWRRRNPGYCARKARDYRSM